MRAAFGRTGHRADPWAWLAAAALAGCGDGVAEPIVSNAQAPSVAPAPTTPSSAEARVLGLCGACPADGRCGDDSDACLKHLDTGETFCGRDCAENNGCPRGYSCHDVRNGERQCVPYDGTCLTREVEDPPPLAELREYMLADLNETREEAMRAPLAADTCLDGIAQEGARELAFENEQMSSFESECGWRYETRGAVAGWSLDWRLAATVLWRVPGRGLDAALSEDFSRVGIGFLLGGDEAWIVLSYGD
jgi:hypothetical protein